MHALVSRGKAAERHGCPARDALHRPSCATDLARSCAIFEASGTRNGIVRNHDIDAATLELFRHDQNSQAKAARDKVTEGRRFAKQNIRGAGGYAAAPCVMGWPASAIGTIADDGTPPIVDGRKFG